MGSADSGSRSIGVLPRRILVMGGAGSGKSTVARQLGDAIGLPVVRLDSLFWHSDWQSVGWPVFAAMETAKAEADAWILDGNYMFSPGFSRRIGPPPRQTGWPRLLGYCHQACPPGTPPMRSGRDVRPSIATTHRNIEDGPAS